MAAARFSSRTEDEIAVLRTELNAKSTIKANKRAAAKFRSQLGEKNQPTDFENFDKVRLNHRRLCRVKNIVAMYIKYHKVGLTPTTPVT